MNTDLSIFITFSAGVLSFFSPCVLPLVPSYLTFILGDYASQKQNENKYTIVPALIFILGFSSIFIVLGLSASLLGQLLLTNQALLRKISGVLIIVLGLHLTGIIKLKFLYYEKGFNVPQYFNKYLRSLIMGAGIALAWTPCIGPILSSVLIYAGNSQSLLQGVMLLSFYSLGFAFPFLLVAFSASWLLPKLRKLNPYLPIVNTITGILIIIMGILIYTNYLSII